VPKPFHQADIDTLLAAERDVRARLAHLPLDFGAMMAVSNIYRAATSVRNRMEREVLAHHGLSWGGFTILFVLWVWGPMEATRLAAECGLAKGTLTGMVTTLERRGLVRRRRSGDDRRRVAVALTGAGEDLIELVFPEFNRLEGEVVADLDGPELEALTGLLRRVIKTAGSPERDYS
jgi:DNA-binding MarR family transcriptional regulator